MRKTSAFATIAALAFTMIVASAQPAQAYIDPGSGSFVLQVLGMFVVSGLFFFRQIIFQTVERLKTLREKITGRSSNDSKNSDVSDEK